MHAWCHEYDFNDKALVYGASFFAKVSEKSLRADP